MLVKRQSASSYIQLGPTKNIIDWTFTQISHKSDFLGKLNLLIKMVVWWVRSMWWKDWVIHVQMSSFKRMCLTGLWWGSCGVMIKLPMVYIMDSQTISCKFEFKQTTLSQRPRLSSHWCHLNKFFDFLLAQMLMHGTLLVDLEVF